MECHSPRWCEGIARVVKITSENMTKKKENMVISVFIYRDPRTKCETLALLNNDKAEVIKHNFFIQG